MLGSARFSSIADACCPGEFAHPGARVPSALNPGGPRSHLATFPNMRLQPSLAAALGRACVPRHGVARSGLCN
eukprot:5817099-Alexandrium_andersonii.AAC.1